MELVRFLRRLLREQPYRFTFAVLALGVVGLLEGAGVAALVPLFDLMSGSKTDNSGTIGLAMHLLLSALHIPYALLSVLLFVIFFIVAQQVANIGQQKLVWGSIYKFQAALRDRLYEGIFRASWPFFVMEKTGDLINSLAMEADRAAQAYSYLNQMLGAILVVIVYGALAVLLSWQMTVLIVIVGAFLVFFLRRRVSQGTVFGRAVTELNADVQNEALENIAGAKLVKGCAAEDVTVSRFRSFVDRLANQQYRMQMNTAWLKAFYDSGSVMAVLLGSLRRDHAVPDAVHIARRVPADLLPRLAPHLDDPAVAAQRARLRPRRRPHRRADREGGALRRVERHQDARAASAWRRVRPRGLLL